MTTFNLDPLESELRRLLLAGQTHWVDVVIRRVYEEYRGEWRLEHEPACAGCGDDLGPFCPRCDAKPVTIEVPVEGPDHGG